MTEQDVKVTPEQEQTNKDSITDDLEIEVPVFKDWDGNPVIEKVKMSELKSWYLRQADFTRKTQELAKQREELQKKQEDATTPDEIAAVETLRKKYGFVTREELDKQSKQMAEDLKLNQLFDSNPDLKQYEWAIREIGKSTDMAYEDIIVKYGFSSKDKLQKARDSRWEVKGSLDKGQKQKSIKEMTTEEYLKWKKEHMGKGDGGWQTKTI